MNVICFGDSNTYGYDPRGYFGGRYDADCRWVDILATETGWTFYNMGQNGREIPSADPDCSRAAARSRRLRDWGDFSPLSR